MLRQKRYALLLCKLSQLLHALLMSLYAWVMRHFYKYILLTKDTHVLSK